MWDSHIGIASVQTSRRIGRLDAPAICFQRHFTCPARPAAPEGPVRELPQAAADHCCKGMVYSPLLTVAEARNTARNLIYTNQIEIRCSCPIYL
jgi:hypothetical protein